MKTELIFIGSELLLGQILNTNAQYLSRELASIGFDCHYQTVVGDNNLRVQAALEVALGRADVIITTGGLGPTSDDLTIQSIADYFGSEMVFDSEVLETIKACFGRANKTMSESNKKLAYRPQGSLVLPNPVGSAPGIIWEVGELYAERASGQTMESQIAFKTILTFPGVPKEMKAMWLETALPYLSQKVNNSQKLVVKELKFFGIGESRLAERIQDILNQADPTVAPLVSEGECRLRMATKALTEEDALLKLQKTETLIREQVGEFIYGFNEDTLESVLASLLIKNKQTLSVAESCTGGLLSKRLTDVPGSSAYISCNLVTYSNQSKIDLLKVKEQVLETHGAVSEEVALAMALGVKELTKSDWAIAITGIAGPDGGSEDKPVGTVFVSVIGENFEKTIKLNLGNRPRQDIRWMASQEALNLLRKILLAAK